MTNNLIYKTTKIIGKKKISVSIRLNDECRNGHQDFAITADISELNGKRWNWIAGGCCHDEILTAFPEFETFVKLHLCDYSGAPIHAVANGYYHLTNGFNDTAPDSPEFANQYCDYYRITARQFKALLRVRNEIQFSIALTKLGVVAQWKADADATIKQLEKLTGETFVNDSVRSQYNFPSDAEIQAENEKIASGYYTARARKQRAKDAAKAIQDKLTADFQAKLKLAKLELQVKSQVLKIGGEKALSNCIFYTHSKRLAFNWKSWEPLTATEIGRIVNKLKLPAGCTIKNS